MQKLLTFYVKCDIIITTKKIIKRKAAPLRGEGKKL